LKGDLHVHSDRSDGSLPVRELLMAASLRGLDFMSVTDHDTVSGGAEALALGPSFGVDAVQGIEISAYDRKRGRKAHLLGYLYDAEASSIRALCAPTLAARDAMTRGQVETLRAAGYPISVEEVEEEAGPSTALYKQHVMAVLTRKGAADGIVGEAYRRLFKGGGICAREIEYPCVFDAMDAIHADGGVAVLAHPGQLDSWDLLDELAPAGLDGIERNHPDHGFMDHCRAMEAAVRHQGLALTGGSDFHGAYGSACGLGAFPARGDVLSALRERRDLRARRGFSSIFHGARGGS
jgi:phosphoribosyl 1,2-cyclic phosphate 1,2-diphosphodiesterase